MQEIFRPRRVFRSAGIFSRDTSVETSAQVVVGFPSVTGIALYSGKSPTLEHERRDFQLIQGGGLKVEFSLEPVYLVCDPFFKY